MNLPGYDAWKLANPYDITADEETALQEKRAAQEEFLRGAIAGALIDERGELYLATIRQIVIEELNKLHPRAGEPDWQTETPIPIPPLG